MSCCVHGCSHPPARPPACAPCAGSRGQHLRCVIRHDWQAPVNQSRRGQSRRQPTRWHPSPPITNPRQVRQNWTVRTKCLRTCRGNSTNPVGIHQNQFRPSWRRRPTQKQPHRQEDHRSTPLSRNRPLTDKKCPDEKEALIDSSHRHRRGSKPPNGSRMKQRWSGRGGRCLHTDNGGR